MTKQTLIRKNHAFLRNVYQIGKELDPDLTIEADAMLEIFYSLEKLMTQHVQSAQRLCLQNKKKKLTAYYLRSVCQSFLTLSSTVSPSFYSTTTTTTTMDQKERRILEIREELRALEKEEKRQESLKRICKYKKEMRKRMREKEKMTRKMIRSLKFISH